MALPHVQHMQHTQLGTQHGMRPAPLTLHGLQKVLFQLSLATADSGATVAVLAMIAGSDEHTDAREPSSVPASPGVRVRGEQTCGGGRDGGDGEQGPECWVSMRIATHFRAISVVMGPGPGLVNVFWRSEAKDKGV